MTHAFMEFADKEKLKSQFSFSSVPFILVTGDAQGTVALSGGLKKCSLEAIAEALAEQQPASVGAGAGQAINVESPQQDVSAEAAPPASSAAGLPPVESLPVFTFGEDEDF
jgi:hypothetical protein